MKNLSVVFLIHKQISTSGEVRNCVLLGKQAPGKKMPGVRNGFGGKCEFLIDENREETTTECANRELMEESGVSTELVDFVKIGNLINGNKCVDFFVVNSGEKIKIPDNDEMVEVAWFDLDKPELFLPDMLSGDHLIIKKLQRYVSNPREYLEFKIDKTGDKILDVQTRNIFS